MLRAELQIQLLIHQVYGELGGHVSRGPIIGVVFVFFLVVALVMMGLGWCGGLKKIVLV